MVPASGPETHGFLQKKRMFLAFLFPVSTKPGNQRIQHLSIEFGIHFCINHVSSCVHPLVCRLYQIVHLSSCELGIMIFTWGITYPSNRCMLRLRTGTYKQGMVASSLERTRPVTFIIRGPPRSFFNGRILGWIPIPDLRGHPVPNHRIFFHLDLATPFKETSFMNLPIPLARWLLHRTL